MALGIHIRRRFEHPLQEFVQRKPEKQKELRSEPLPGGVIPDWRMIRREGGEIGLIRGREVLFSGAGCDEVLSIYQYICVYV